MNNTIRHLVNDFEVVKTLDTPSTNQSDNPSPGTDPQEFMKAKAGFLMLCIGMMCFTGFGNTTADLTENSTADVIQVDLSVNVVAAPAMDVVFDSFHSEAAFVLAVNTDAYPVRENANQLDVVVTLADQDVGWCTIENDLSTSKAIKDPGGVLSMFYI